MIKKKILSFLLFYALSMAAMAAAGQYGLNVTGSYITLPRLADLIPRSVSGSSTGKAASAARKHLYFFSGKNHENISRFFTKLRELELGRRQTIRIMHFGDSLIWADNFSSTLRKRFQERFGDGGRGIVPASHLPFTLLDDHVNRTPPGHFIVHRITHRFYETGALSVMPATSRTVGFSGESCYPVFTGSTVSLQSAEGMRGWNLIQVYLRTPEKTGVPPEKITINCTIDSREERKELTMAPGEARVISMPVSDARSFSMNFFGSGALPYVDGINLETGRGIAYSTFVRMGTHLAWLGSVPEDVFSQGMSSAAPDLIIFQYGINEAASLNGVRLFTENHVKEQMAAFFTRLKKAAPGADVLVIGPPERLMRQGTLLVPMKETLAVIELQRRAAFAAGMTFFDTYEFLGGEGHMAGLAEGGLAMDDYMHLSRRGGAEIGGRVFQALMKAYGEYSGNPAGTAESEPGDVAGDNQFRILFNSVSYAWFFAIVALCGLALLKVDRIRIVLLVAASLFFYFTWEPWVLLLLIGVSAVDYTAGVMIYRSRAGGKRGTAFLAASLAFTIGALLFFKYAHAVGGLFPPHAIPNHIAGFMAGIVMPAGISFYIFKSLSYTIDVWKGGIVPEKSFPRYLHFVSFFPQILSGPISKAREFLPRSAAMLRRFSMLDRFYPRLSSHLVSSALFLIFTGLLKKAGADWLGSNMVDRVYGNPAMFSSLETLAAVTAYGAQIYLDFSGYTNIAIGSASLLGYRVPENFMRPYLSMSVSEFWRRWHITLGSWFREYVYIGLGGNRKRVYFNLLLTMFLCGLWHGSGLNFAVWGLFHGFFLAIERLTGLDRRHGRLPERIIRTAVTLAAVLFGWIIFRVDSWDTFAGIMRSLGSFTTHSPNLDAAVVGAIISVYALHFTPSGWKRRVMRIWRRVPTPLQGLTAAAVTVALFNIASAGARPFIYFRF